MDTTSEIALTDEQLQRAAARWGKFFSSLDQEDCDVLDRYAIGEKLKSICFELNVQYDTYTATLKVRGGLLGRGEVKAYGGMVPGPALRCLRACRTHGTGAEKCNKRSPPRPRCPTITARPPALPRSCLARSWPATSAPIATS